MLKKVPAKNKGLKKLPTAVRNKMRFMKKGGKLNKQISDNFLLNQNMVAEFLTEIFDYMKNSKFKLFPRPVNRGPPPPPVRWVFRNLTKK